MGELQTFLRIKHVFNPKILKTSFLILFFFLLTNQNYGQERKSNQGQWESVGGQIVASGSHDFTNFWYLGGNGKWYKNNENRNNPANHTSEEVNKDILIKKGQFTVQGPGFIAKFQRKVKSTAVGSGLKFAETGADFWTAYLGGQDLLKGGDGNWKWYDDNIIDFDPNANNGGWVPAGKTLILDIYAHNHESGIGYKQYAAPKSVEYEYWFFPIEGGKIISKADIINNNIDYNNPAKSVGKVTSGRVFDETSNKWLNPGDDVHTGHFFTTGRSGNATITFSENNTVVKLNNNTKIKVKDKITKKKSSGVSLVAGRLWSLFKGKKKNGYAVETFNSVTSCEGTEFETSYNPETGETNVSVFEGTVSFECKTGTEPPVYLEAGMSASMDNNCKITSQNATSNLTTTIATSGKQLNPIADNHVYAYSYSNWNNANWGKYEQLGAGWNPTGGEKRAYLKFDLSNVDPSTLEKAILKLYHNHTGGGNSAELGIYAVEGPWTEGRGNYKPASAALPGELTWNNQPKIARYPTVYFNPGQGTNKWVEVDVTTLVKAWLTPGFPNHGMAIKAGENYIGGSESQYGFYSRESKDADKRPRIMLNGSASLQNTQGGLGGDVIKAEENIRPWVIGTTNGIHYGTNSGWKVPPGGGKGKDISIDGNGRPWVIGTDNGVYYHDDKKWIQYPGAGKGSALAVSSDGIPWVIGAQNKIYYGTGSTWTEQPGGGRGKDIAVDQNGRPWVIGTDNGIYYYEGRWIEYRGGGRGSKLAISKDGMPWVVGNDKDIFYNDGSRWIRQPGSKIIAKDIALDDQNRPWVLKSDNRIFYHNGNAWVEYPGGGLGLAIAVSNYHKSNMNQPTNNFSSNSSNLLINGSFEDPPIGWFKSFKPGENIQGWKVINANVDLTGTYFKSSEGKQSIDLHGSPGFGGIQQTIATQPNQKYKLEFDFAGNPAGAPTIKRMLVSAAGQSKTFEFDCTGKSTSQMAWSKQSWTFTANSYSTTIAFSTLSKSGMGNYGPAIDNVKVYTVEGQSNSNVGNISNNLVTGQWEWFTNVVVTHQP